MYTQDYDNVLVPTYLYSNDRDINLQWFADLLQPYVKNSQVFICPNWSSTYTYGRNLFPVGEGAGLRTLRWSYGGNNWHHWPNGQAASPDLIGAMGVNRANSNVNINASEASVERPSDLIYMMDAVSLEVWNPQYHDYCNFLNGPNAPRPVGPFPALGQVHVRHSGGFNMLFVDWHAKWTKKTRGEMWARETAGPNRDPAFNDCRRFAN